MKLSDNYKERAMKVAKWQRGNPGDDLTISITAQWKYVEKGVHRADVVAYLPYYSGYEENAELIAAAPETAAERDKLVVEVSRLRKIIADLIEPRLGSQSEKMKQVTAARMAARKALVSQ